LTGSLSRTIDPFDSFRAKTIGFIFQFHHLIPNLTLLENVELPLYSFPILKQERRKKAIRLLEEMGLEDRMHFLPTRVSGGRGRGRRLRGRS